MDAPALKKLQPDPCTTCAFSVFVVRCQSVIRVTEALEAATVIANDVYILNVLTAHSIFIVIYSFIVLQLDMYHR